MSLFISIPKVIWKHSWKLQTYVVFAYDYNTSHIIMDHLALAYSIFSKKKWASAAWIIHILKQLNRDMHKEIGQLFAL